MNKNSRTIPKILVALCLITCSVTMRVAAERPIAPRLLPEQTLAFFRVANTPDLIAKFKQTSTGRLAADEKLQPLLGQLWQMAVDAYQNVEGQVGVELPAILKIPQGEICVAVIAPEEGIPQLVMWIDCGDQLPTVHKLLDRAEERFANDGAARTVVVVDDIEMMQHDFSDEDRQRHLVYFIHDSTLFLTSDLALAKQVLSQVKGEQANDVLTLADNRKFTAIMSRSAGTKGEEPQVTWFADPIQLVRRGGRGNISAQTGLAVISGLGIDGIQGLGGSVTFATEEFDSIMHAHVLIENPRRRIVEALALQSGDVSPEPWVPADVESYTTLNWDVGKTYREVVALFDMFNGGEGSWDMRVLVRFSERTGIDLQKDLINAVTGRVSLITWMQKPAVLNSQSSLVGLKLNDPDATRKVLHKVAERFSDRIKQRSYGGVQILEMPLPLPPNVSDKFMRPNVICAGVLDDYLLISNNPKLIEQTIVTRSDASRNLANELDFKIVASKIKRQLGDAQPGMISFTRPEEGLRQVYDLANSETMRGGLRSQAENNKFFKGLDNALSSNPLPPFSVLAQYLAPAGALVTNDETGFHYMAFSLKREKP